METAATSAINPEECQVFVQVWIDFNALTKGKGSEAVHLVDNRVAHQSQREGTATLLTNCALNSKVCWSLRALEPKDEGQLMKFQEFTAPNVFGLHGAPEEWEKSEGRVFTGQVENDGEEAYLIGLTLKDRTVTIEPWLQVAGE